MLQTLSSQILAWTPGPMELVILGFLALLLFGRRLPEVARSMGRGVVEFKRGLRGVEDEVSTINREVDSQASQPAQDKAKE